MDLEKIQQRIEQLEQLQRDMKVLKVTLEDALKEDDQFQEVDLQLRELNTKKKRVKDEIWGQATYQESLAKLKDMREESKDLTDILTQELLVWREANNTDEIIGSDGTTRKLKINVRVQQQYAK